MIRATFCYSMLTGSDGRFDVDAQAATVDNAPAVLLTYKSSTSASEQLTVFHVGQLTGYTQWSEAPLALVLRALFFLRTQWYWHIPTELLEGTIRGMDVAVKLVDARGDSGAELATLSLAQLPGAEGQYSLAQSPGEGFHGELNLRPWTSFPLGVAFNALAQSQSQLTYVDLQKWPEPLSLEPLTNQQGHRYVLREHVPKYALQAFDAYGSTLRLLRAGDCAALIPAAAWQAFLAA